MDDVQKVREFEAKMGRWALILGGLLWVGVSSYKLIQPNGNAVGGCILLGMGLVAFTLGIFPWRCEEPTTKRRNYE